MARKTFLKVRLGLLAPQHRDRLGVRIWLYLHILSKADWDTGIVYGWRDKEEAEDLNMSWRTLQQQRQQLEEDGYIICKQAGHYQNITITKYADPREPEYVESRTLDDKGTIQGTIQGTISGNNKHSTLPFNIDNRHQIPDPTTAAVFSHYSNNIDPVITPVIADRLGDLIDEYPQDWIIEAINIAVENNVRKLTYFTSVLKRWKTEGKDSGTKKEQPAIDVPRPSLLCKQGENYWRKASNGGDYLQRYQDHIGTCHLCGEAEIDVTEEIRQLADKLGRKKK